MYLNEKFFKKCIRHSCFSQGSCLATWATRGPLSPCVSHIPAALLMFGDLFSSCSKHAPCPGVHSSLQGSVFCSLCFSLSMALPGRLAFTSSSTVLVNKMLSIPLHFHLRKVFTNTYNFGFTNSHFISREWIRRDLVLPKQTGQTHFFIFLPLSAFLSLGKFDAKDQGWESSDHTCDSWDCQGLLRPHRFLCLLLVYKHAIALTPCAWSLRGTGSRRASRGLHGDKSTSCPQFVI